MGTALKGGREGGELDIEGGGGGGKFGGTKWVGEGRVGRLFCIHELPCRIL